MELRRYWALVKRWYWLIALTTIIAGGAAFLYSATSQPIYRASTTLLVNMTTSSGAVGAGDLAASERIAGTYGQLAKSHAVLQETIKQTGIPLTVEELGKVVSIQTVRNTQLLELTVEYSDPVMAQDAANKMAAIFIAKNAEMQRSLLTSSLNELANRRDLIEQSLKETSDAIAALKASPDSTEKQVGLANLGEQLFHYQNLYVSAVNSYDNMKLIESRAVNSILVAEPAVMPIEPVKPRPLTDTALGLVVGLLVGVGIVFLLDYLDDTVKTSEDVLQVSGLATLAQVVRFRHTNGSQGYERGLIAKHDQQSPYVESYRVLRTNIQYSSVDKAMRTMMVTSSLVGEGKTTTAGNLAAIMAQGGRKVILVDADLRQPSVHRLFGLTNAQGLTSLLISEIIDVDSVLQPAGIEGVQVVTSGPLPPYPAELLGSAKMATVLATLVERADVLIIDAPPVLLATDAAVLSTLVDGVILVAESGKTRMEALAKAVDALETVKRNAIGVVLNKVPAGQHGYYGYYSDQAKGRGGRARTTAEAGAAQEESWAGHS